jgi:hypothetical protein
MYNKYGKDVKIMPPSTRFYVASTTRQNFKAVSYVRNEDVSILVFHD